MIPSDSEGTTTMLDEAWALALGGDRRGALRRCAALLAADPHQLGAAALAVELLIAEERPFVAAEVAKRLVDAYVRRSDLPSATAAAALVQRAGEDASTLRRAIARAFGKGSARLADVSPAPPPLPTAAAIDPALSRLSGRALFDRVERALETLLATDDPVPPGQPIAKLPLFSALAPDSLERLLAVFSLRALPERALAITQGEEGREAFVVVRGTLRAERGTESVLAVLGPGSIFGEMALVSEAPRAASVVALEPVQLLVASRDDLETLAQADPTIGVELASFCRARMIANLVRHGAILGAMSPAQRTEVLARFETKTFQAGETLVRRGEESAGLYLVASGRVRVVGKDVDGDNIVIADLGPGDVVGEIGLVLRRPATATVTALHPTVTLHLPRERFQEAIRAHPELLSELYEIATRREDEMRSVVAQKALDAEGVVLV
jgi:cAMP-dependent protein kinase regulator